MPPSDDGIDGFPDGNGNEEENEDDAVCVADEAVEIEIAMDS